MVEDGRDCSDILIQLSAVKAEIESISKVILKDHIDHCLVDAAKENVAYGLSIFFYVYAQRMIGAARTSAYYAIAPFIGTILSLIIFRELPHYTYFIALALMIIGAWLCSKDEPVFKKHKNTPHEDHK